MGKCSTGIFITIVLTFIFNNVIAQAPAISYTPATNVYTVGTAITTLAPANTGGVVGGYSAVSFFASVSSTNGVTFGGPSGYIYATNTVGNAMYIYNAAGTLIATKSGPTYGYNAPVEIVVDAAGTTYVANNTPGTVVKTTAANVVTTIPGFTNPTGITSDASGNLYVADNSSGNIYKIAAGTTTVTTLLTGFSSPWGIAVNSSGDIFVSQMSAANNVIKVANGTTGGTVKTTFASGFNSPRSLSADAAGNIYLADCNNGAVKMITPGGTVSTLIAAGLDHETCLSFDLSGNMYISNYNGNDVVKSVASGYAITSGTLPAGLSLNAYTGVISGTPTSLYAAANVTIRATNGGGSSSFTVNFTVNNPTAPTGTGGSVCSSGTVTLTASGSTPAGGVYNWYAALSGGASLGTGATYTTPVLTATTTYYADYTLNGATSTPRTAVTATVNAAPVLATVPAGPAGSLYLSYPFTGNANDVSGNGNNGTLQNAPSLTADRYGNTNSAYSFNGTSQYVSTTTLVASPGPQTFSISMWFKTSLAGGKLVGFGSLQTGQSNPDDRHIYMSNSGQLYFGVYPGAIKTINTTTTYADGNWHHVVATESTVNGANLYVDGALQASDATMTASQSYAGYWRVGYDYLTGWPNKPTDYYFNGSLDDVAIYNTELTTAQVRVLYGAGSGTFCAGNPLSLTANTVAGATYAWSGPGGYTSALQNPTVPSAVAGTYVLTVTGASCSSTLNVTAPSNVVTYTWSGAAGTTNPATAGNWDQLPAFNSTSNLIIPTGLTFYPSLTANETICGLTIASGATFNLNGFTLNTGCNIINNASTSGTGILYGANNSSALNWNGSVAAQGYTGTNTANTAQLGSMTVNNSAGGTVTINGGPIDIYNLLTITNGNLVVGSSPAALTLKSTATQSANVAAIPSGSAITGNVNVERYISGGSSTYRGYRLLSSPVYAGAVSGSNVYSINYLKTSIFLTGTSTSGGFDNPGAANPTLYLYRENLTPAYTTFLNSNFKAINNINASPGYGMDDASNPSINIPVGNRYLVFFRGNRASTTYVAETVPSYVPQSVTLSTSGTLNQGQVTVKDWFTPASSILSYTAASPATVRGYNLAGNPYASSIDWENFQTTTTTTGIYGTGIGTTVYMFDPISHNYGAYTQGNAGVGTNNASNIISSGQGFFVVASSSSASLIFNESAKTNTQVVTPKLLMGEPVNTANAQYLRLQLAKDSVNTEDILLRFNSKYTTGYDEKFDAQYMMGYGKVNLCSITSDNIKLAINTLPLPKKSETIKLMIRVNTDGIYSLNMKKMVCIPQLFDIWLMDGYTKDSLDMRHNPGFTFNVLKSDSNTYGSNRFTLVIRQNPAYAYRLLNFAAAKVSKATQVQLIWTTENEQNYTSFTVERSINNGKTFEVLTGVTSSGLGTYSFLDKTPVSGLNQYRLKQEDLNGNINYSNVMPIMYSNLSNNIDKNYISVYPNPAVNTINIAIVQNTLAASKTNTGPYSITIWNSNGSIVKTTISSPALSQENISNLLPGTYIVKVINNKDESVVGRSVFVKL